MALIRYPWHKEFFAQLNALRDQLPNGILVYGPRGSGVFDCVHAFAESLMCMHPAADGTPCGQCKGCKLFAAHNHPDVRYVVSQAESVPREIAFTEPDRASGDRKTLYREILIHQTRALTELLTLKSHEGGVRVVLVYPADRVRAEAAASLLKSLEEPPENLVFLLVADEIDRVLPTIRSRCRLMRAPTPSQKQALAWLESQNVADARQKLVQAAGMPLAVMDVDERFHLPEAAATKLLKVLAAGRTGNVAQAIDAAGRDVTLSAAALMFSRWAWDLASARQGGPVRYFPEYAESIREVAAHADAARLYTWINSVRDVRRVADHPLNAKTVIQALLLSYQRHV